MVSAACMVVATWYIGGREALWVTFAASAGAVMLFTMVERRKNAVKDVSLSLFALTYVGLIACFIVFLLTQPDGNFYIIIFLASVVASDTGGYVFGVLWGKHPIAPRISPKKSWEGYLGSTVFAAIVATILAVTLVGAPFWTGLVIGAVIPALRDPRRLQRIDDQTRSRTQGHGHPAARPRRSDGPTRLDPAHRPRRPRPVHGVARLPLSSVHRRGGSHTTVPCPT